MKRWAALGVAAALALCLAVPGFAAGAEDDLEVIKKAVRGGCSGEPEKGLKWFKVLITDKESRRDVVKLNLPIFVAGTSGRCSTDKHQHHGKAEAKARSLKKLGPLTLLEIVGDDAKIKIWLE